MGSDRSVCMISGGLDSAVAAKLAKDDGCDIYALSFDYGQRHIRELECARKIAEHLNTVEHKVIKLDLRGIGGSALTDDRINVPSQSTAGLPLTYVPARNTIMLSVALAYAEVLEADCIYIGANYIDYSGYPDCRPEYFKAFQEMADLATKRGVEGKKVEIKTPLIKLSKKEIIQEGARLGVPFQHTWSCYCGSKKACGVCDSCRIRLRGFQEAGLDDPLEYDVG